MAGGTGAFQAGTLYPGFLLDLLTYQQNLTTPKPATNAIAIASTATVYGQSFVLRRGCTYGWEFQASSSGTVALTIELEQANQPPNTELAQDDAWVIPFDRATTNGLVPAGTIISTITYITAYSPDATILGRLKITGGAGNDASTKLIKARFYEIKNF